MKNEKDLRAKYKRSPAGVKIRRHNGQNGYGPWMRENDSSIPSWVGQLVDEQMIEEGLDEGIVMQGGSYWQWKK
jgi:hypothetical protein